jgi:hypothetical protein
MAAIASPPFVAPSTVRRFLTWLLILVLPLQSAWAAVTLPCAPQAQALQVQVAMPSGGEAAHGPHAAHALGDGHGAHHGHDAAMINLAASADDGQAAASDGSQQDTSNPAPRCKASAACISLHSPPLAGGSHLQVPTLAAVHSLRAAEALRFSSAVLAPRHRPPIARAA